MEAYYSMKNTGPTKITKHFSRDLHSKENRDFIKPIIIKMSGCSTDRLLAFFT